MSVLGRRRDWELAVPPGTSTIGVSASCLACVIGFPAGRAIGLYAFRGRRLVQFLVLAPVVVPGLAVTLGPVPFCL